MLKRYQTLRSPHVICSRFFCWLQARGWKRQRRRELRHGVPAVHGLEDLLQHRQENGQLMTLHQKASVAQRNLKLISCLNFGCRRFFSRFLVGHYLIVAKNFQHQLLIFKIIQVKRSRYKSVTNNCLPRSCAVNYPLRSCPQSPQLTVWMEPSLYVRASAYISQKMES